jgi:hypothetical protein
MGSRFLGFVGSLPLDEEVLLNMYNCQEQENFFIPLIFGSRFIDS